MPGLYGSPELGPGQERPSTYSVTVDFIIPSRHNRFWAIPVLGYFVKQFVLIPHLIAIVVLTLLVSLTQLVLWGPVLLSGHYPRWGYALVGGYVRWITRVNAFAFGLTDQYPPFRLRN
jgi:Domain of unknown function (DUF4389)